MTPIEKIVALEHAAADFGFEWETTTQIMQQIKDECVEIEEHLQEKTITNPDALQEEIGDLFHAVFSLCVFCKFDPEVTIKKTTDKFERRLNAVKAITKTNGLENLKNQPFDKLMNTWNQAKDEVG